MALPHNTIGSDVLLSLLDQRDRQQVIVADAQDTIAGLNTLLANEDEKLQQYIDRLHTLIATADSDIQKATARKVRGERAIAAKEKEIADIMGDIEGIIGTDAMNVWRDSLGEDDGKERPKLPARMRGVRGEAIKDYIRGPLGNGMAAAGGGGGAQDKVPVASEIGSG